MVHNNQRQQRTVNSKHMLNNKATAMMHTTQLQDKVINNHVPSVMTSLLFLTGQEQVVSYGQDQGAAYNTAHSTYTGTTADQYGQGTAAGYGYTAPTAPYTANYQDQPTIAAAYGHGQAPQRSQFPPYGGR